MRELTGADRDAAIVLGGARAEDALVRSMMITLIVWRNVYIS